MAGAPLGNSSLMILKGGICATAAAVYIFFILTALGHSRTSRHRLQS
jgi:hypothetical protein